MQFVGVTHNKRFIPKVKLIIEILFFLLKRIQQNKTLNDTQSHIAKLL